MKRRTGRASKGSFADNRRAFEEVRGMDPLLELLEDVDATTAAAGRFPGLTAFGIGAYI
jgi:hypothetical protein